MRTQDLGPLLVIIQVVILAINDDIVPYANDVKITLENAGLRTKVDDRTESLNKKVREAQLDNIPIIITIGPKEKESGTLSVRTLDGKVRFGITHENFLNRTHGYIKDKNLDLEIFKE